MALNRRIILTLTLITLLIQNSLCNPLPQPRPEEQNALLNKVLNHLKTGGDKNELTPKEQLFLFSLQEFEKLANYFEESSTRVVESTLKDEDIANGITENVIAFKKQLHEYLDVVENHTKTFPERLGIMEAFSKLVNEYDLDDLNATTVTEDQKYFARILDKHGLGQLNRDFGERFLNTLNRIFDETKKYMSNLHDEDMKRIQKFVELMDTLKTQKTNDDKLKYIFNFIDNDNDSKEKHNGEH